VGTLPRTRLQPPRTARRIERDLWSVTPHLYAVSAKASLITNVCGVIAEMFFAVGPP